MRKFCPHALGKHAKIIESGGFVLTETKHQANLSVSKHTHSLANLVCVLRGSFSERIGSRDFECQPQNILLKPAEETHATKYEKAGAHCLIIELQPERLNYFLPKGFDEVKQVPMTESFNLVHRIFRELRLADNVSDIAIEGLTLELLAEFTRKPGKTAESRNPRWIAEAKDFIHANFHNQISLSTIAETVSVHPSHLSRVFRSHFRCSIGDYIRRLRLEYAADQLLKNKKTFAEIAAAAGFYDQSHFANTFKNYMGLTPTEYRATKD